MMLRRLLPVAIFLGGLAVFLLLGLSAIFPTTCCLAIR